MKPAGLLINACLFNVLMITCASAQIGPVDNPNNCEAIVEFNCPQFVGAVSCRTRLCPQGSYTCSSPIEYRTAPNYYNDNYFGLVGYAAYVYSAVIGCVQSRRCLSYCSPGFYPQEHQNFCNEDPFATWEDSGSYYYQMEGIGTCP